jgi:hypothetical protein
MTPHEEYWTEFNAWCAEHLVEFVYVNGETRMGACIVDFPLNGSPPDRVLVTPPPEPR